MSAYAYPNPQAIFYQQYNAAKRDEVVGILLALFLGGFGAHHFYMRRTGMGILYLCFCWTGIPSLLGFIECFFMPGRVREFNSIQAAAIAASLGIAVPGWGQGVNVTVNMPPPGAMPGPMVGVPAYPPPTAPIAMAPVAVAPVYQPAVVQAAACPRCRNANPPGARFCVGCGQAL